MKGNLPAISRRCFKFVYKHSDNIQLKVVFSFFLIILTALCSKVHSQTVLITKSTNGNYTQLIPVGVNSISVQAWGSGGGGAGNNNVNRSSSGGGGGAYTTNILTSTSGNTYNYTVGSAGTAGAAGANNGGAGNSSFFGNTTAGVSAGATVIAVGGGAGQTASSTVGAGGAAGSCTPSGNAHSGGNGGGTASSSFFSAGGGGGGSSAGTIADGNTGTSGSVLGGATAGGTAVIGGGAGGNGGYSTTVPTAGGIPGGGGGGATNGSQAGAAGAAGQVTVLYYLLSGATAPNVCIGSGATVNISATLANLPAGTYTVTYSISGTNSGSGTASMIVTTPGSGSFSTSSLASSGSTTITATALQISGGSTIAATGTNAATLTVNAPPSITGQPASPAAVCAATNSSSFTVTATGTGLTYQWQRGISGVYTSITAAATPNDGATYSGFTTATLTVTNAPASMNGYTYRVVVTSNSCTATSDGTATLTVNTAPTITGQPASPAAVCAGTNSSSFTVTATGTGLTYQWQRGISGVYTSITAATTPNDGATYSGFTTATLTVTNAPSSMNGYTYQCVVSGTCTPAATSNGAATLTVNAPPSITGQPASPAAVCAGTNSSSFTVTATGTGLTYQWQRGISGVYTSITAATTPNDGATYSGFTTATLTVTNAPASMNGYTYRVVVTSNSCTATSDGTATLTVNTAPTITGQPASPAAVCAGTNSSSFTVTATGTGLTYQWQRGISGVYTSITAATTPNDGATYSGFTTATLTVTNAPSSMNGYTYRVVVSGTCTPAATSNGAATLTVNAPPSITGQPASPAAVCAGTNSSSFTVTATGTGLTYQWQRGISGVYTSITAATTPNDGATYSGFTTATLTVTNAPASMNGYTYRVVVSGTCTPAATSDGTASLTVNALPTITGQPSSPAAVCAGTNSSSFTVTATGTGLTYQWQRGISGVYTSITAATTPNDGATYSGFTTATLTVTNAPSSMNGYTYRVVVTNNSSCTATSNGTATLAVNTAPSITGQPANQTGCTGGSAVTFSVTASGTTPTYQWQYSSSVGGPYTNATNGTTGGFTFAGVTTSTVSITATSSATPGIYYVQCVVNVGGCTSVTSNSATYTVITGVSGLTYSDASPDYCQNSAITPTTVSGITGGGTIIYSISPTLPAGLSISSSTGAISGTPTAASSASNYTVTATNGCSSTTAILNITVNTPPTTLTVTPASATICSGTIQSLTATGGTTTSSLFSEGFETFPTSNFAVSGSKVTAATNTTYYSAGTKSVLLSYAANSSTGAYASQTNIDLTAYNSAQLTFSHICAMESNTTTYDVGYVQYSTDGGSTWITFPTSSYAGSGTLITSINGTGTTGVVFSTRSYSAWTSQFTGSGSTPGTGPATSLWKTETINIPSAVLTSAQFRIRYLVVSDGSVQYYGWLIDDINISGVKQSPITWSPATGLYTNTGATTAYITGTAATTVYAKPTATTTYTATATSSAGCTASATSTITVNQKSADPTSATTSATTICNGTSTTLTLNGGGGGTGEVIKWYSGSCGGTLVGTGNNLSVSPIISTTYYGRYEDGAPCNYNSLCASVAITVNQKSANPTSATASATTICNGVSTTLTLNGGGGGTGEVIKWYTVSCGGTLAGTGNNLSVSPIITTTYFGRYEDGAPCNFNTTCASVTITVNQKSADPTSATASATTICNGTSTTLTLNGGGGGTGEVIKWYSGSCGGTLAGTGNNLSVSPITTTIYYGRYEDGTPCNYNSLCASITITVNQKSANPTSATASFTTICNGGSTTLTLNGGGGGTGEVIKWYSGSCGGTMVGTGNNLSVSPTTTTTYYGRYEDGTPCNYNSLCASITITVNQKSADPTSASASDVTVCSGSPTTLTLNGGGGGTGEVIHWYSGSCGGTPVGTGNNLSVSPTTTTTYYGRYEDGTPCSYNSACASVMITVRPAATVMISGTTTICSGSSATITFTGTPNASVAFSITDAVNGSADYGINLDLTGTFVLGTGALTNTTTYALETVEYGDAPACTQTATGSAVVTVNQQSANPTSATASVTTICNNGSSPVVLTLNGGGGGTGEVIHWYSGSCGGTAVGTGNNLTVNPTTTTTYYGRYEDGTPCSFNTTCQSVTITVSQMSADPTSATASVTTICNNGSSPVVLTLNGGGGGNNETIHWYSGSCGGTAAGTGNNLTVSPTITTTYYGRYEDGTPCSYNSACASVTITVSQQSANPTSATASFTTICNGSSTTLTLNGGGGGTGEVIHWYSGSCGGTPVGTGNNLTVSPATTTTYYGRYEDGAPCNYNSACASVTITVNQQSADPTSATASSTTICYGGSTNLILNGGGGGTGEVIHWYSVSCGGTPEGTGNNLSVSPTTTTTYYGRYEDGAPCNYNSLCASVTITVTTPPSATINYSSSPYCSNGGIASVTQTGTLNGTYSSTTGLVIDAGSGEVDLGASTAGTYTVTYTVAASGGCAMYSTMASITITAAPSATINYYGSPYCPGTGTATVTRTGTPNGTYTASSSGLSINSTTGDVDLSASFSGTYTVTYTIPAAGGCGVYTTTASIVINIDTWNGISSTDWNDAANWSCGAVPTINSDAVIPVVAGYYPSVATVGTPATVHNITISSGASLTVTAQTLQISDSIFNSGVFDVSIGTLEFNGTIPQIIPAGAFTGNKIRNIIISNSVSLNGLDSLSGVVSFGAANKTFTTNDNLTLKSNVSRTGSIGVIDNGNAITGNVTVERYIATGTGAFPNHAKSWQLMAVPTVGQTLKQSWMEGATISDIPANGGDYTPGSQGNPVAGYGTMVTSDRTTALADGFDAYTRPGPTVKTFNYLTDGYVGLVNANVSLYDKKGYFVFVRGDRSVYTSTGTADHTILRTKGTLFTPANLPPIDTVRAGKFESIGNPYASPVDMTKISATGGNVNQYFYVWDPRLGGSYNYGAFVTFQFDGTNYEVQTNGGATYPANGTPYNYIQNGQAFFMQATGADGFVTFNEAAKAPNASFTTLFTREGGSGTAGLSGSGARTTSAQSASLRTGLHAVNADGSMGSSVDEVLNQFGNTYSAAVDGLDARKMLNTGENLSVRTTGKLLAIEQRHTIVTNDTVFLNMTGLRAQPYQLSIDAKNLNTVESGFVEDAYTNTRTQLNISGNTQISFTVANVAASYAPDRFRIVFTPLKVLPVTFTSVKAYRHDKDINVEWNVNNERNIKQYDVEKSADGKSFSALAAAKATNNNGGAAVYVIADAKPLNGYNYYRVKTTDVNGAVSYSTIVKVEIGETKHEINIYPNPITDGQIHLQFSNEAAGNYGIRLLNKLGQVIMEKQVTRQDGSSTELIKWNFNLAHGMYNLEVTRPDGTVKNINVMY